MSTQQAATKAKLVWVTLLFSTTIYVVIAYLATPRAQVPSFDEALRISPVPLLYTIAALMFAASGFVSRIFSRPPEFPGAEAEPAASTAAFQGLIVRWALIESVCIFGLVAAFLTRQWLVILPPFVLSMIGFALSYPKDSGSRQ